MYDGAMCYPNIYPNTMHVLYPEETTPYPAGTPLNGQRVPSLALGEVVRTHDHSVPLTPPEHHHRTGVKTSFFTRAGDIRGGYNRTVQSVRSTYRIGVNRRTNRAQNALLSYATKASR